MKHIREELEQIAQDLQLDKQHKWLTEYKLDPIRLGRMCEQFPGLQNSWNEFKMMYEICRSQDEIDRKNP